MGYEFFEEKIIFPSTPVPGINNDQSLNEIKWQGFLIRQMTYILKGISILCFIRL